MPQRPATPAKPPCKHSKEPQPFPGLTHKPYGAACAQAAPHPKALSPVPPALLPPTTRRPRMIDTSMHFCPHEGYDYRGWLGRGNLRASGHPSGGPWRQWYCCSCHGSFLETPGTICHGKRMTVELSVRVLAAPGKFESKK